MAIDIAFTHFPCFITNRLRLRSIRPDDAEALFAILSDRQVNESSKNLLLKLGFTYEGNLRQRYVFGDRFEDEHYFGLLKDEWPG